MWGSRTVFGRSPDTFKAVLEYGSPSVDYASSSADACQQIVRLPVATATVEFGFRGDEAGVGERFAGVLASELGGRCEERVVVRVRTGSSGFAPSTTIWATSGASVGGSAAEPRVRVELSVAKHYPVLRCVQLSRLTSTGQAPDAIVEALLSRCDLTTVWKLKSEARPRRTHGACMLHPSAALCSRRRVLLFRRYRLRWLWQLLGGAIYAPRLGAATQPQSEPLRPVHPPCRGREPHGAAHPAHEPQQACGAASGAVGAEQLGGAGRRPQPAHVHPCGAAQLLVAARAQHGGQPAVQASARPARVCRATQPAAVWQPARVPAGDVAVHAAAVAVARQRACHRGHWLHAVRRARALGQSGWKACWKGW
eukprot:364716-Chlamydomonas_euryale.AAC.4